MKNIKKVPILRFPEFSDEWKIKELGNLLEFKNGLNCDKEQYGTGYKFINVLDIINNDFIKHEKIIGSVDVTEDIFEKNKVIYGDILFQRSSETREEVGQSNVYLDFEKPATFGGFVIRGKKIAEYDPLFMHFLLKTSSARKEITTKSGGSTRYNVGQEILKSVLVIMPSIKEQKEISNFFSMIDIKIEKLTKKKQLLEKYKKGVMQKIFNQEIRFKNDNSEDYPEWEKQKLENFLILKSNRNKDCKVTLVLSVNNKKGFVTQDEQFNGYSVASQDLSSYKVIHKNEFAYNPSRINVGSIARLKSFEKGIVSPMYVVFKLKDSLNSVFFENLFDLHKFKHLVKIGCSGSVRDTLNFDVMQSFNIFLPCIEEQQKIADFLTKIDNKISLVEKQLNGIKKYKKSLLQQMFI